MENMRLNIAFFVFIFLMFFRSEAQNPPSFYPFKGFHVGITGQAEFIQKPTFFLLNDGDPIPKGTWSYGWEAGIEFSYHFAKYFGVSIGINYGTALSYECAIFWRSISGFNEGRSTANTYQPCHSPIQDEEIIFPLKFEFHYPLRKDLFFTAEAGVKLKGVVHRLSYGKGATASYSSGTTVLVPPTPNDPNVPYDQIDYFDYWGERNISEIHCNLLIGIGLYYKLPYGDLLRFTTGVNLSFKNIIEGHYVYQLSQSWGVFTAKNDFIYTQLSYIHTLNWQKAKKYLKKQEFSFSSKKERRQDIIKMLKSW